MIWYVYVAANEVDVVNCFELTVTQHCHLEVLFCGLFDLLV
jgi:hypothetical protein